MSGKVTLAQVNKCLFTIAKPATVVLNAKARVPAYLLSLELSQELLDEHHTLHKKKVYSSSAQITHQHGIDDLEGSLLLTCINFPRKQIGPKMSDCLACGVLPHGPDVDPQFKRDNTVYVRPFLTTMSDPSDSRDLVGAPVGVFPSGETRRTTNPRDLLWDEFEHLQILTGTVLKIQESGDSSRDDDLVSCDGTVDFRSPQGTLKSRLWLRRTTLRDENWLEKLRGRQVMALVNLESESSDGLFEDGMAAILTVNGYTTLEPAKPVENGYRLA